MAGPPDRPQAAPAGLAAAEEEPTVMAIVLTHNAPRGLGRCLRAVAGQTRRPDAVLVVDNDSRVPVSTSSFPDDLPRPQVLRSAVNGGPAGGYALALARLLATPYRRAWVLDDDMTPDPGCLEQLWAAAADEPALPFVFPIVYQEDGSVSDWPSWCGFLVAREIVEQVGLPMEELFWWAEDTEYLQWRIPEAGHRRRVVQTAVVHHQSVRHGDVVPLWKYYYESRNLLYVHLYLKRRVGRYPRSLAQLLARATLREGRGRARRLAVIGRGLADGARGRLGVRYPVEPMTERRGPDRVV